MVVAVSVYVTRAEYGYTRCRIVLLVAGLFGGFKVVGLNEFVHLFIAEFG